MHARNACACPEVLPTSSYVFLRCAVLLSIVGIIATLTPMSMMVVIMMQAKGVMSGGPGTNTERDEERDAEVENPVTGQGDDG